MNAAENVRQSASGLNGVEINGGDFAGAQNGSCVELIAPLATPSTAISSGKAQIEAERTGELFNKQDGNQSLKNRLQRKASAMESDATSLMELPPGAPIKVRGRPVVLTPELLDQLCQLVALGFSRAQAAAYVGLNRSTITKAAQKNVDLQNALQRAEEVSELQPQLTVMAEARKNWRAAAWLLQFKAKHHHRTTTDEDRQLAKEKDQENHDSLWASVNRNNEALAEMNRQIAERAGVRGAAKRKG